MVAILVAITCKSIFMQQAFCFCLWFSILAILLAILITLILILTKNKRSIANLKNDSHSSQIDKMYSRRRQSSSLSSQKRLSKEGIYYVGLPWLGGQRRHYQD